jgi:hypothetical protein
MNFKSCFLKKDNFCVLELCFFPLYQKKKKIRKRDNKKKFFIFKKIYITKFCFVSLSNNLELNIFEFKAFHFQK